MTFGKPLKSAFHHWWPQSLSKAWVDADGCVTRIESDGSKLRRPPAKFTGITNAHHIKPGESSPWNSSFEPIFDGADGAFPKLTPWLQGLEVKHTRRGTSFADRLLAAYMDKTRRRQLAECLSSLIVRSPRSRHLIRITVEDVWHNDGLTDFKASKSLIAANMPGNHPVFTNHIAGGGKFVVLKSEQAEFIFGDGFLHNFPTTADRPLSPLCLVPLLPNVSVLYFQPTVYRTYPELMTVALRPDEVTACNEIVQSYSCDYLFCRKEVPVLSESFTKGDFLELVYHRHPGVEALMAAALNFA
jgi:hypothetical protein